MFHRTPIEKDIAENMSMYLRWKMLLHT